jgi:D-xylose transport system ATP-binding protein
MDGQPLRLRGVPDAEAKGIVMIPQELSVVKEMSIAENIFLNREPSRFGVINTARMRRDAAALLRDFDLDVEPELPMKVVRIAKQQLVEIAKALVKSARLIILDEPTSALSSVESEHLFSRLRQLKQRGITCLYVSHRINEVLALADRVVVLRDGRRVGSDEIHRLNHTKIVSMMLGRDVVELYPVEPHPLGDVILELENFSVPHVEFPDRNIVESINLQLRTGEVLGLFGLMGAGRTELVTALFGAWPVEPHGQVRIRGKPVRLRSPIDAIRAGMALLTEDRKRFGLVMSMDVQENITLGSLARLSRMGLIDSRAETEVARSYVNDLAIKPPVLRHPVMNLSGGNQQKVLVGRGLATNPSILVLDEPTRGIDIGAKADVFHLLNRLARAGLAVLFISSELPEVLGMSDRILVMCNGRITGEFQRQQASEEVVLRSATGLA